MIPAKFEPLLFGLILSGIMSMLVSGIATFRAASLGANFLGLWVGSWLTAWLFAFPSVLLAAPSRGESSARSLHLPSPACEKPPGATFSGTDDCASNQEQNPS